MKKILSVVAVGFLASASYSHAVPGLTTVPYGARYFCEFEGEGSSEHGHQDRDFHCKVEGVLIGITAESAATPVPGNSIEIKCSNGYKLEAPTTALSFLDGNLWINAENHDKLATIRVRELLVPNTQEDGRRYEADLLAANSIVVHGEGKCRFEFPVAPPAPPVNE